MNQKNIFRQFPFSSSLARMSVIVRELSSSNFIIFTKVNQGAETSCSCVCTKRVCVSYTELKCVLNVYTIHYNLGICTV